MSDLFTSIVRTIVPVIVGSIASFLATKGIDLDAATLAGLSAFLAGLFSAVYYLIVRLLEQKFPQLGLLLGSKKTPEYTEKR